MKNLIFKNNYAVAISGAMEADTISIKNEASLKSLTSRGNIFSDFKMKKIFLFFVVMVGFGINAIAQDVTHNDTDFETVELKEYEQSRKDVIVMAGNYYGFQTEITQIDDNYIYYIIYKKNGTEKVKKIKKKHVAFTLTFDEKAKLEKYPLQMNAQDFLSLPTYRGTNGFVVFGTDGITNFSQLKKIHPDIIDDYVSGDRTSKIVASITFILWAPTIFAQSAIVPMIVLGAPPVLFAVAGVPILVYYTVGIIGLKGDEKIRRAFEDYYKTCIDLEVCAKYGIIITPYDTFLTFGK